MCIRDTSGGINQGLDHSTNFLAAIIAHEMGHNFGFLHDAGPDNDPLNTCSPSGYIMNSKISNQPPTEFSSCSRLYFELTWMRTFRWCLNNEPTSEWGDPVCGNGITERNETGATVCVCVYVCLWEEGHL
jgi:hypothetical protein